RAATVTGVQTCALPISSESQSSVCRVALCEEPECKLCDGAAIGHAARLAAMRRPLLAGSRKVRIRCHAKRSALPALSAPRFLLRSEERRVGQECILRQW